VEDGKGCGGFVAEGASGIPCWGCCWATASIELRTITVRNDRVLSHLPPKLYTLPLI